MKKQVVVIHGAETFDNYEAYLEFLQKFEMKDLDHFRRKSWKKSLGERLGGDFEIIAPEMPNGLNAKYLEWKIWFDKIAPLLNQEVVLVGHSLGGTFLTKYLAENKFPKNIRSLHLVAPAYDAEGTEESMADFIVPSNLDGVSSSSEKIFIYQSNDDVVVPPLNAEKFKRAISSVDVVYFEDRGHFRQEEFPELVENIRKFS